MSDGVIEAIRYLWAPIMAIFAWALWSIKQATVSRVEVHGLIKHDQEQDERIAKLEGQGITHQDLAPIYKELNTMKNDLTKIGAQHGTELENIKSSVGRIEDYLLENLSK